MNDQVQVEIQLLEDMVEETSSQTERVEKYIERLLGKLSSIITISSIISFLSFAFIPRNGSLAFVKYYLIWVMPLLLLAIVVWIVVLRSSRAVILNRLDFVASNDPNVTVQYQRARLQIHNDLYSSINNIYNKTKGLISVSLSLIFVYLLNFLLSFYLFIFTSLPSTTEAILIEIIMILLAELFQRWYTQSRSVSVSKDIKLK